VKALALSGNSESSWGASLIQGVDNRTQPGAQAADKAIKLGFMKVSGAHDGTARDGIVHRGVLGVG